jgi:hypothetical protein
MGVLKDAIVSVAVAAAAVIGAKVLGWVFGPSVVGPMNAFVVNGLIKGAPSLRAKSSEPSKQDGPSSTSGHAGDIAKAR